MKIRFYDIEWDVTDSANTVEEEKYILSTLPTEVIVDNPDDELIDAYCSGWDDELADYLSDEYGYCLNSFMFEEA